MNCRDVAPWLQSWLDAPRAGAPLENREVQDHLAGCQSCREQFGAAQRLMEGLRRLPRPVPPAGLSERIVARSLADRAARRRMWQRRLRFTYALAASILVMVIAGYFWEPSPPKNPAEGPITKIEPPQQELPKQDGPQEKPVPPRVKAPEPPPALAKAGEEAKDKVAALTGKLFGKAREHTKHLIAAAPVLEFPPMGPMSADFLPTEPIDPTASLVQAGQEITGSLEPVTRSARRAMDSLFREISTFDVGPMP